MLKRKSIDVEAESTANQTLAMLEALQSRLAEKEPVEEKNVPRCCYCGDLARGRIIFLGPNETIVDNPFCTQHEGSVMMQTYRSLRSIWAIVSINREMTYTQRWIMGEQPPLLPRTKEAFLIAAGRHVQP